MTRRSMWRKACRCATPSRPRPPPTHRLFGAVRRRPRCHGGHPATDRCPEKNLGIAAMAAVTQTASPTLAYPARVTLPPASVRVVAAAGAGLVTQLHVQAGDTVKRGAPLVTLSMPGLADAQNRACAQRNPRCSRHAPASWRRRLRCRCWGRARCQAVRSR